LFGGEERGELFLVPETILQSQHRSVIADQRRKQIRELIVGGGLEPDDEQIRDADFLRSFGAPGPGIEVALAALNGHAAATDDVVVRAQEKVDLLPIMTKLGAVKTAYGAASDDRDFHL